MFKTQTNVLRKPASLMRNAETRWVHSRASAKLDSASVKRANNAKVAFAD